MSKKYACRAGTTTRFYWGDDPSYTVGNDYAWWQDNAGEQYAHVVGSKLPNAWGLYDMVGNVWEFCEDLYEHHPSGGGSVSDPTGAASGSDRVYRGCAWDSNGRDCRSAYRGYDGEPTWKEGNLGFRLAR